MNAPKTVLVAFPALLALAAILPAIQQDSEVPIPAHEIEDDDGASIFGEPLFVNGRRITDMEIKRFLCYGKGRNALESRRLGLLMQQEKELRWFESREQISSDEFTQADGTSKGYDELGDEEKALVDAKVTAELEYMVVTDGKHRGKLDVDADEFQERYPMLDHDTEVERAYESVQWYEDQVRQTMEFDAMFFPDHPDTWPEISIEAIHAGAPNIDLIADYQKYYEIRAAEAAEAGLDEVPPEDEMMMGLLRDYVMAALASLVDIRSQPDGLPPEILMTVEGGGFYAELRTDDVYEEMKHVFNFEDIARAKKFLALQAAARDELAKLDVVMPDDEFLALITEWREQMEGSMFSWDFMAIQGHQFPSVESYTSHLQLLESYKTIIAEDLERTDSGDISPALRQHLQYANIVLGIGRCQTEVLLVSAFDFPSYRWKENAWAGAEKTAFELRAQIDKYIEDLGAQETERRRVTNLGQNFEPENELVPFDQYWSNTLDLSSEWWDPPMPVVGKMPPAIGMKNKGRFGGDPMTRNDFKRAIGESSYYYYLANSSVTDLIFRDQEPQTVAGPYKGPWGYYLTYLKKRLPPSSPIDPSEERHFQMLTEDYARQSFQEYAHECLSQADVKGL